MITRTHIEIRFFNIYDDHKSPYLEILILGSFLKNHFSQYVWLYFNKKMIIYDKNR